ncbi:MAG: hypothetical protein LBM70_05560 [Victivallales bacterium]|nr:hypothetical protein [Victivallales bacterium]
MWSEILSFLAGCVATGFVIKFAIVIKKRNKNTQSNAQAGSNIANESSVAAGTINGSVSISHFYENCKTEGQKKELSQQAKNILKEFFLSNDDFLLTFAPACVVKHVQTEKIFIKTNDLREVDDDLDNLVTWGYLRELPDSNSGRKFNLTSTGKQFAEALKQKNANGFL